jgi:hypothetical protein
MKIRSTFNPRTDSFKLIYDEEVKTTFLETSRSIPTYFDSGIFGSGRAGEDQVEEDFAKGSWLITRLGTSHPRSVDTDAYQLDCALFIVSWAMLRLRDVKQSSSTLERVLIALANVTPLLIPACVLPPASKVLSRERTPVEAWDAYEVLATWQKPGLPFLFMTQAYELWLEIRNIANPQGDLKKLISYLDASSSLFRMAMGVEAPVGRAIAHK